MQCSWIILKPSLTTLSMEKLSSIKPVPSAEKVGDHWEAQNSSPCNPFFLLHWCCHPIDWTLAEFFKVAVCVCWPSKFVQFVVRGQQTEICTSKICLYLNNWSSDARSSGEQWHVCVVGEKLSGLVEYEWSPLGNNTWWPKRGSGSRGILSQAPFFLWGNSELELLARSLEKAPF